MCRHYNIKLVFSDYFDVHKEPPSKFMQFSISNLFSTLWQSLCSAPSISAISLLFTELLVVQKTIAFSFKLNSKVTKSLYWSFNLSIHPNTTSPPSPNIKNLSHLTNLNFFKVCSTKNFCSLFKRIASLFKLQPFQNNFYHKILGRIP